MKVAFLLPVPSQPRFHRRIAGLQAHGIQAKALYFARSNYFRGGSLPCDALRIGEVRQSAYVVRLLKLVSSAAVVRRETATSDAIYAFGLDMAMLGRMASRGREQQLLYELGDVHSAQLNRGVNGRVLRILERWVLSEVSEVIVTARGYATGYFDRFHPRRNAMVTVMENQLLLPESARPSPGIYNGEDSIVIGYFGLLRCPLTWSVLKKLAVSSGGRIKVEVRGRPMGIPVAEDAKRISGIHFGGEYTSPDDLPEMYRNVDLIWGCNSSAMGAEQNWLWARTNRFFESCFFRRPLIALYGGDEGKEVEALGNGITVTLDDPDRTANELLEIVPRALHRWQRAAFDVPAKRCLSSDEFLGLADRLRSRQKRIGIRA